MSMANMNHNAMPMEANTTLMVCNLIDGKEVLPQALHNKECHKGGTYGMDKCGTQEVGSSQ